MSAGIWVAIGLRLLKLWGLLRGGKGYRAKVEIRSEAAIEARDKKLAQLKRKMLESKDELDKCTLRAVEAKAHGLLAYAAELDDDRAELRTTYRRHRQEFLDAGGRADELE